MVLAFSSSSVRMFAVVVVYTACQTRAEGIFTPKQQDCALPTAKQFDTIRTMLEAIFGARISTDLQRGTRCITGNKE